MQLSPNAPHRYRAVLLVAAMVIGAWLALLAGCSPQPAVTPTEAAQVACAFDGALVPVSDAVLQAAGGTAAVAAGIDAGAVHPAVVAACAAVNGTPATVPAAAKGTAP